jgi:hypothetical protein
VSAIPMRHTGHAMNHYFFDLVSGDHAQYDYAGRHCAAPEEAYQLAELIALDLENSSNGQCAGWSVQVRDRAGNDLFFVRVREPECIAA